MSRLSRFKKDPAVKLPPRKSRFEEDAALESDDEDKDVFKKPQPMPRQKNDGVSETAKSRDASKAVEENLEVSKYFQSCSRPAKEKQRPEVEIQKTLPERKIKPVTSSKNSENPSRSKDRKKTCMGLSKESVNLDKEEPLIEKVETTGSDPIPVYCPFCTKKLNDKLHGITHIKACAKGLPTEKIYKAILLQEKQIEEWRNLGLDFPAASSKGPKKSPITSTSTANNKTERGNQRKQTLCDDVGADASLELALALSISLHEEAERRNQEEKRLLVKSELENEVEGVDSGQISLAGPSTCSITFVEPNLITNTVTMVPSPGTTTTDTRNRRHGKRIVHEKLPLATINDVQKKDLDKCDLNEPSASFKVEGLLEETVVTTTQANLERNYPDSDCPENFDSVDEQTAVTTKELVGKRVSAKPLPPQSTRLTTDPEKEASDKRLPLCSSTSLSSPPPSPPSFYKQLPQFVQDIANMLLNKIACDISVYCRKEKAIKCHTFILRARCPKLLDELVVESGRKNLENRNLIPLTSYTHEAVKAFLWYLYTGTLESRDSKILKEVHELAIKYDVVIDDAVLIDANNSNFSKEVFTKTTNENVGNPASGPYDAGYICEELTSSAESHPSDVNDQLKSSPRERKRCRAVSLSPEGFHTATDVANYMQRYQDQDKKCDKMSQKRQKFDDTDVTTLM